MLVISLGALLVVGGVLYLAGQAIGRGRLSGSGAPRTTAAANTLEPPRRGVAFLGLGANWPGLLLIAAGALLLIGWLLF